MIFRLDFHLNYFASIHLPVGTSNTFSWLALFETRVRICFIIDQNGIRRIRKWERLRKRA